MTFIEPSHSALMSHPAAKAQRLGAAGVMLAFVLQMFAWTGMVTMAAGADGDWIVVCSSEGIKRIWLNDAALTGEPAPVQSTHTHCDLCVLSQSLGTGSPASVLPGANTSVQRILAATYQAELRDYYYADHQPRAPPLFNYATRI